MSSTKNEEKKTEVSTSMIFQAVLQQLLLVIRAGNFVEAERWLGLFSKLKWDNFAISTPGMSWPGVGTAADLPMPIPPPMILGPGPCSAPAPIFTYARQRRRRRNKS